MPPHKFSITMNTQRKKTIYKEIHLDNKLTQGEALAKQQIHNADHILDQTGLDIVTCGSCGCVNIVDVAKEVQECYSCGYTDDTSSFPSIFFNGMTISREVTLEEEFLTWYLGGSDQEQYDTISSIGRRVVEQLQESGSAVLNVADLMNESLDVYLEERKR